MSRWVPTTCMRCAVGCGLSQRGVDRGYGLDAARGDATHPVSRGLACNRGTSETASPDGEWLTRPLIREDSELIPTTWERALGRVVREFRAAIDRDPDSLAVLGSGQQTTEAAYALGKVARGAAGTRNYDANTTLCMASAVGAYYNAFGSDAPPPTYEDIPEAERHVIWGANPAVAHPVLFRKMLDSARENGCELVVVDPVRTRTAQEADRHVQPAPGTDLALARAVLAQIVDTDRIDAPFIDRATTRFDGLVRTLPGVEEAAAAAGTDLDAVETLAEAFTHRTLCYWGMGVNQHVQGTATAGALIDLCLATGNLRPGSGPFSLTGQANSMGTRVCSSKGTWPGHREFTDPAARTAVADAWTVPETRLPDDSGPGPVGMLEAIDGEVDVLWTVATNPAAGFPDAARVEERLEDVFLVAQDAFRSETTALADVVLPAATWGESAGTTMNMERTVSRVRPASALAPGVRTDLDLITTIGNGLDPGLFERPAVPAEVFAEFAALTEGTAADCSGITYERLEHERAVRWPAPDLDTEGSYRYYSAEADTAGSATEQWRFPTPPRRARFSTTGFVGVAEPTDDRYPLTLTTAREPDGYNTGIRSRESPMSEPPVVRAHPATVETYVDRASGEDDATITLETRRDAVAVRLSPDDTIPEGLLWLSIHHPMTNRLTIPDVDPESKEPNYKQCAARLVAPTEPTEPVAAEAIR
jgi:assimilatory nitrate reductase catalytic subunit